jgi:Putative polyhydroxyalkanoic acid system protein (PHA_gran_rgn)
MVSDASFFSDGAAYMVEKTGIYKMSKPLVVSIPHRLGREEASRRLKAGLTRAALNVPVLKVDEERWEGDRMIFRVRALGQAAAGHLDVAEDHVRLEVSLPWLLQRFAEVAQAMIQNRGSLLLTKRD